MIPGRSITVKGIAWGGGGLGVARVDVSADGGEHFTRSVPAVQPIRSLHFSQATNQKPSILTINLSEAFIFHNQPIKSSHFQSRAPGEANQGEAEVPVELAIL